MTVSGEVTGAANREHVVDSARYSGVTEITDQLHVTGADETTGDGGR